MNADIIALLAPYLRRWNILRLATIGFADEYIYMMRYTTQILDINEKYSMLYDHNYYTIADNILIIAPQLIYLNDEEYDGEYIHHNSYNIILYKNGSHIRVKTYIDIIFTLYYLHLLPNSNRNIFSHIMDDVNTYSRIDRYIYKYLGGYCKIVSIYNHIQSIMYYLPWNMAYYCKSRYYIATKSDELVEKYYISNTISYYNRELCDIRYDRITGRIIHYIAHTIYMPRI